MAEEGGLEPRPAFASPTLSKRVPHLRVFFFQLAEQVRLELTRPFQSLRFSRPLPLGQTRLTVPKFTLLFLLLASEILL